MLGLFIVVTYVEQRLIVLPNTAGKKELYGSNPCFKLANVCHTKPLDSILWMDFILKNCRIIVVKF